MLEFGRVQAVGRSVGRPLLQVCIIGGGCAEGLGLGKWKWVGAAVYRAPQFLILLSPSLSRGYY